MDPSRYVRWFIALVAVVGALDALVHLVFDPHQFFGLIDESQLGLHRSNESRQAKAELFDRGNWDVVLVGSSRAGAGIGRSSEARAGRIFNLGLMQTNMCELLPVLSHVIRRRPKHVVLFLELDIFQKYCVISDAFKKSRFGTEKRPLDNALEQLLGYDGLVAAWDMVRPIEPGFADDRGFFHRPAPVLSRTVAGSVLTWTYTGLKRYEPEPSYFSGLEKAADLAEHEGVRLSFVFSPVHATVLAIYGRLGLVPEFERIKSEVARIAVAHQNPRVWDFARINELTGEPVPAADDQPGFRWFREPAHFNQEFGAFVIDAALTGLEPRGVGVELTRESPEARGPSLEAALADYASKRPGDVAWVDELLAAADRRARAQAQAH